MRMTDAAFRKLTGFIFIITPLSLFIVLAILARVSDFPDLQAKGVDEFLTTVHQSGTKGVIVWYISMIPGILYMAAMAMFHKVVEPERIPWLGVVTTMGIVAWAVQLIGLVRWIFVFPYLGNEWVAAVNDPQKRAMVEVVYNAFTNYTGFALGQTVGIHLTAIWTFLVGLILIKSPLFKPWHGYLAIVIAIGMAIGNMGPLGAVVPAIDIQTLFNVSGIVWYVYYAWMAYIGLVMLRSRADVYDDYVPATRY
jgi:Domain of unknown function (DUF4386)